MTEALTARAERAVADFESAGNYLRGPYFEALVTKALGASVIAAQSPWLDRTGAAAHCRCSTSEIDRATAGGIIHRYTRGQTPLYLKSELDEAIRGGRWRVK